MAQKELSLAKLEQALEDLEQLVARLEEGDLPLNEALTEFERGIKLTRQCQALLKNTEQKIEVLLAEADEPVAFEPDPD